MENQLSHKAVSLNKRNLAAKTLVAQSQDRYLCKMNQPQRYGAQRFEFRGKEYLEPTDSAKISETERNETSILAYVISDSAKAQLIADNPVEIVGGTESLVAQIHYPELAKQHQISGKVTVEVIIDTDEQVIEAFVVNGLGYGCDEEALRVIRACSYLNHSGENQEIRIRIPFQLTSSE